MRAGVEENFNKINRGVVFQSYKEDNYFHSNCLHMTKVDGVNTPGATLIKHCFADFKIRNDSYEGQESMKVYMNV